MTGYPICLVEIHGAEETFEVSSDPKRPYGESPSGDLLSCTTQKRIDMASPAGHFDLQLARVKDAQGRTWMDKIRPQDMVVIQMMNHHGTFGPDGAGEMHTVMIGWVDAVEDFTSINDRGIPERRIRVRGRDAGKILSSGSLTWWSFLGANLLGAQRFIDVSRFNAKPASVVRDLIEEIYHRFIRATVQYRGAARDFWDLFGYRLTSYDAEIPAGLDYRFVMGEGTFWSFLSTVASAPFHELFVDTRRQSFIDPSTAAYSKVPALGVGKDQSSPVLVLRPLPWPTVDAQSSTANTIDPTQIGDSAILTTTVTPKRIQRKDWDALVRHEVGHADGLRSDPILSTIARSGDDQPNMYMPRPIYPMIPDRMFSLVVPPILDKPRFQKYGYRPYAPDCSMLQPQGPGDRSEPMMQWYTKLAWRLAAWNFRNEEMLSGTKVLQLSPHLHIGERLVDRSSWHERPYEFYIESISHQWVYQGRAGTTLGVTRGLPEDEYVRYFDAESFLDLFEVNPTLVQDTFDSLTRAGQESP